jgi:membrane protein
MARRSVAEAPSFGVVTANKTFGRVSDFFETHIWDTGVEPLGWWRRVLYRVLRIGYTTTRAFREKELTVRAASLTYYTILSIVPFLAFAFSILKGFGLYHKLVTQTLNPLLEKTFAGNDSLRRALEQMLSFVESTNVSGLSVVGALVLAYTAIAMLSTVETAFNDIWDARTARTLVRKFTDYTTMMVVGPLLVMLAIGLGAAAENSRLVAFLSRSMVFGDLVHLAIRLTSFLLVSLSLIALYVILPNVRTRLVSAIVGGVVAGLAWQILLLLEVKFQVGVARYNALYSGFAALPIFLVWLYASWIIVLVGAQLAASQQYETRFKQAVRTQHVDQELREELALVVAATVARSFVDGRPPATAGDLAEALGVPPPPVEGVLDALVRGHVLVRVGDGEPGYDPARDLDTLHVADIEQAVRMDPEARPLKDSLERAAGGAMTEILRARAEDLRRDSGALTLRQVAFRSAPLGDGVPVESPPSTRVTTARFGKADASA